MKFARNAMARRMFVLPDAFAPNIADEGREAVLRPRDGVHEAAGEVRGVGRDRQIEGLPFPEREEVPYPELSKHLKPTFQLFRQSRSNMLLSLPCFNLVRAPTAASPNSAATGHELAPHVTRGPAPRSPPLSRVRDPVPLHSTAGQSCPTRSMSDVPWNRRHGSPGNRSRIPSTSLRSFIGEEEEARHRGTRDVDRNPRAASERLRPHPNIRRKGSRLPEHG